MPAALNLDEGRYQRVIRQFPAFGVEGHEGTKSSHNYHEQNRRPCTEPAPLCGSNINANLARPSRADRTVARQTRSLYTTWRAITQAE